MKKKLIFYFIILMLFCQYPIKVEAISDNKKTAIIDNCDSIKDNLKKVQKEDSRTRVYLGGYYETILTKFITPLNMRLVENNLSSAKLIENQNDFADAKALFASDFIVYQQSLEELIGIDCKKEPEKFYDNLDLVRKKRKIVEQDVLKVRSFITEHIKLVDELKGRV